MIFLVIFLLKYSLAFTKLLALQQNTRILDVVHGIFNDSFIANFPQSVPVKEF